MRFPIWLSRRADRGWLRALLPALLSAWLLAPLPVAAQTVPTSTSVWLPGPDGSGAPTYSGAVDQSPFTNAGQLAGWVVDTSAQGWSGIDDIVVWNGLMGAGGQQVTRADIQISRPDVAASLNNAFWANSGYSALVPASALSIGASLYVYAHTPDKGWWYLQLSQPVAGVSSPFVARPTLQVQLPTPLGTVHSAQPFTMRGYAFDPSASSTQGTGVDRVEVYLNGDRATGVFIGDATLGQTNAQAAASGGQFATAGWQLTFQANSWLTIMSDNQITRLTVYAHSSVTGREAEAQTSIIISVP
jgi:hypothetical protein